MNKKNFYLYTSLLIIATLFLGIAYATIANVDLYISGDALIMPNESIDIISATYKDSSNADLENSKVSMATKTVMKNTVMLEKDKSAFLTLHIEMQNNTSKDLYFIETIKNDNFYKNYDGLVNTQIVFELNGLKKFDKIEKNGGKANFDLTFKYNVEDASEIENANRYLDSYLNFRFREIYNITYNGFANNDYADKLIAGDDNIITFEGDIPESITVIGDVKSTYIDVVLTLTDVESDIVITKEGDENIE